MKKVVGLIAAMTMVMSASAYAGYTGGHWVCQANNTNCWYKYDNTEYRGTPETTPSSDIIKEESSKAEAQAAKLEGDELIAAANAATMEAAIAKARVAALNNRIAELAKKRAEDEKKGVKMRGWWSGNCYNQFDVYGNVWWRCY